MKRITRLRKSTPRAPNMKPRLAFRLINKLQISVLMIVTSSFVATETIATQLRVASFNVSIESNNYIERDQKISLEERAGLVQKLLSDGTHSQIKNIAEIIQTVNPDVVLLNEFDYISDEEHGVKAFVKNYLNISQNDKTAVDYPYTFIAPVNTGEPTEFDLDNDGKASGSGGDAFGFGLYPGQYGMAILSKFPIDAGRVRTFQRFLWKDMPGALAVIDKDNSPWYSEREWNEFRLSSKSHWVVPVLTNSGVVNIIAAHPTPPVFDGDEDRNGKRNHDEIRLINDLISNQGYVKDDSGQKGGLSESDRFVILGDLNSSPHEGDSIKSAITGLLSNPRINSSCTPSSQAGKMQRPDNPHAHGHTAAWGLRVDYVLPSTIGFEINNCGIFWPTPNSPNYRLVENRAASSDHRLVWIDLSLKD